MTLTLKRLIAETVDQEFCSQVSEQFISVALEHPRNSRIVDEYRMFDGTMASNHSPGRERLSLKYRHISKDVCRALACRDVSSREIISGFPSYKMFHDLTAAEANRRIVKRLLSHGIPPEKSPSIHTIDVMLPCGELWLPVLSHPRGNETHVSWWGASWSELLLALNSTLAGLRDETKDTPLCKSLESYSLGCKMQVSVYDSSAMIESYAELAIDGSTLKRVSLYLY